MASTSNGESAAASRGVDGVAVSSNAELPIGPTAKAPLPTTAYLLGCVEYSSMAIVLCDDVQVEMIDVADHLGNGRSSLLADLRDDRRCTSFPSQGFR